MVINEISIQNLYDEIIENRTELRNIIEASEVRPYLNQRKQNRKISNITDKNLKLRNQLEFLDMQNRRNNLAIFGIEKPQNTSITENYICEKLNFRQKRKMPSKNKTECYQ